MANRQAMRIEIIAQAEQIAAYKEELKAVYSSAPCPKCGYGITGGCYGCEIKRLKAEKEFFEKEKNAQYERLGDNIRILQAESQRLKECADMGLEANAEKAKEITRLKELLEQALVYLPHDRTTTDLLPNRIKQALAAQPQGDSDE